jgi:uncharacterized protein YeaO (DUF488 family)
MPVRIVRLGSPRQRDEGLRLGTVRKPPRGVKKSEYAARDYYDVWFPNLAPSLALMRWAKAEPLDTRRWKQFERRYRAEMAATERQRDLELLSALSHRMSFSVGCYCEDESRCHRLILKDLLRGHGAAPV